MLQQDPEKRPTAAQALEHEWFKCDEQVINQLLNVNQAICSQLQDMSNIDENEDNYSAYNQSIMASFIMGQQNQANKEAAQKAQTMLGQENQNGNGGDQS